MGLLALPDEVEFAPELAEAGLDRRAQFLDAVTLRGIIAREARDPIKRRNDCGDGLLVVALEFWSQRQEIAAQGALGAPDFEQQAH